MIIPELRWSALTLGQSECVDKAQVKRQHVRPPYKPAFLNS